MIGRKMNSLEIKKFIINFFNRIEADIKKVPQGIIIRNVSEKFQKFSGNIGDFNLCFEKEIAGFELINEESHLLKIIAEYLKNKGRTSLIKLNFDKLLKEKIKTDFILKNCEVNNESKKEIFGYISRFVF